MSCSCEEKQLLSPDIKVNENFELVDITISKENDLTTRCSNFSYLKDNYYSATDYCNETYANSFNMELIVDYEDEILVNETIMVKGQLQNIVDNYYVTGLSKTSDSNLSLRLRFPKIYDPSKIKVSILSSLNTPTYGNKSYFNQDSNFNNELQIYNHPSDVGCNYFIEETLSETKSWDNIKKSFVLNRLNAEILVFITKERLGIPNAYVLSDFYLTLNDEPNINKFLDPTYAYSNIKSVGNMYYSYTIAKDEVRLTAGLDGTINNTTSIYSPTVYYNNKKYYYYDTINIIATKHSSYPKTKDGKDIKYFSLIFDETDRNTRDPDQSHYDGHLHVHWNTLPLPEGGLQANKRYIYLLNDSYPLWENKINIDSFKTRSSNDQDPCMSMEFQLLEQDLNELLPFEIKENN